MSIITVEYRCPACKNEYEYEQDIHEDNARCCPGCDDQLERLISLPILSKMGGVRTIGSLWDKSASKKSYEKEEKLLKEKQEKKPAPWGDCPKHIRKIIGSKDKADLARVKKYIDTGK